jgi:hypothetical protein
MTWRRLTTLIHGLSPQSLWALTHRARSHAGHRGPVNRITDPKAIESYMAGLATRKAG